MNFFLTDFFQIFCLNILTRIQRVEVTGLISEGESDMSRNQNNWFNFAKKKKKK